jgi:hypothetical protein
MALASALSSKICDNDVALPFPINDCLSEYFKTTIDLILPESYTNHPPNDANAIKNGLNNYYFALSIFEDALEAFLANRYRSFDALIGNNSCYLVSYLIFLSAQRVNFKKTFKQKTQHSLNEIKKTKLKVLSEIQSAGKNFANLSLRQLLHSKNLDIHIELDFIYLGMAYACAQAKIKNSSEIEEIDYQSLLSNYENKINIEIKKKSAQKLIKHWQKTVSYLSVKTLQIHSKAIHGTASRWAKYIEDPYVLQDERERLCTSSLFSVMTIYDLLLGIPGSLIGLQVNLLQSADQFISRFTLYFEVKSNGSLDIINEEMINEDHNSQPIYMFVGCRHIVGNKPISPAKINRIKKEFSKRSLSELVLAHEVTYPQYPKSLKAKNIDPEEFDLNQEIGKQSELKGFSIEDPSDLCLVHIFVDDFHTQSLAVYEPPIYLPQLGGQDNKHKACN